jgi:hypothetical protein
MVAATLFALAAQQAPGATGMSGEAVFAAARSYVTARSYPSRLVYHIVVKLNGADGHESTRTYDSAYDGAKDIVYTHSISEEEAAQPYVPRGIDVLVGFGVSSGTGSTGASIPLNRPGDDKDVLGVPMLAPTYAFGLGRQKPVTVLDSGLPIIGSVSTNVHDYDVTYIGEEAVGGETCSHIKVVPTHSPDRLRLRELWIASDGAPLKIVTHGNFTSTPWDGVDWIITFRRAGTALYVDTEHTRDAVRVDRYRSGRVTLCFRDIVSAPFDSRFIINLTPRNTVREP